MLPDRKRMIVIADARHARFVRVAADGEFHTEGGLDAAEMDERSIQCGVDPSAGSVGGDRTRSIAAASDHDAGGPEAETFAQLTAMQINAAAAREEFEELVLVAAPTSLASILLKLTGSVRACVVGCVARDLVRTPDHALWQHLHEWADPRCA